MPLPLDDVELLATVAGRALLPFLGLRLGSSSFAAELGQLTSAQRSLTAIKINRSHAELLTDLSDFYQLNMSTERVTRAARFLSGSCKNAVFWRPRASLSTPNMSSLEQYRWLLSHHFLLPIPDGPILGDRCTDPRHTSDTLGHHLFNSVSHRAVTHDNTHDRLHTFFTQAGLKLTTEPQTSFGIKTLIQLLKIRYNYLLTTSLMIVLGIYPHQQPLRFSSAQISCSQYSSHCRYSNTPCIILLHTSRYSLST